MYHRWFSLVVPGQTRLTKVMLEQTIALCIAETDTAAQAAARAVVVSYVDLPAIVTVAEALEQGSLYDMR